MSHHDSVMEIHPLWDTRLYKGEEVLPGLSKYQMSYYEVSLEDVKAVQVSWMPVEVGVLEGGVAVPLGDQEGVVWALVVLQQQELGIC